MLNQKVKILIVEDDPDMAELICDLVEAEGWIPVTAPSAEAAQERLQQGAVQSGRSQSAGPLGPSLRAAAEGADRCRHRHGDCSRKRDPTATIRQQRFGSVNGPLILRSGARSALPIRRKRSPQRSSLCSKSSRKHRTPLSVGPRFWTGWEPTPTVLSIVMSMSWCSG